MDDFRWPRQLRGYVTDEPTKEQKRRKAQKQYPAKAGDKKWWCMPVNLITPLPRSEGDVVYLFCKEYQPGSDAVTKHHCPQQIMAWHRPPKIGEDDNEYDQMT
jgi:hypothetical protein